MASRTTHEVLVKGRDQTAPAFNAIRANAAATATQLRNVLGSALAVAGGYFSLRAVKSGIDELGHLSDVAMKASTNVGELTSAANALNILGITSSVDSLAKAFQFMEKNTGRSGLKGFYDTIEELGKIPDAGERAQQAMKVFGKSGLEFMPLINAAHDGTDALRGVVAAMSAIPQSAADAGDAAADALAIAGNSMKSLWLQALGEISNGFDQSFKGGIRQAAATAAAYLEYYPKVWYRRLVNFCNNAVQLFNEMGGNWGSIIRRFGSYFLDYFKALGGWLKDVVTVSWDDLTGDAGLFGKANANFSAAMEKATDKLWEDVNWSTFTEAAIGDLDSELAKKLKLLEDLNANYAAAAMSTSDRAKTDIEAAAQRAQRITNQLVMGGSNASMRLAITGPQLQSEQRRTNEKLDKTNQLLGRIADATNKTADGEEYGTID